MTSIRVYSQSVFHGLRAGERVLTAVFQTA